MKLKITVKRSYKYIHSFFFISFNIYSITTHFRYREILMYYKTYKIYEQKWKNTRIDEKYKIICHVKYLES